MIIFYIVSLQRNCENSHSAQNKMKKIKNKSEINENEFEDENNKINLL